MSYTEEYKRKLVTADEAVKIVKSGDWLDYGTFMGQVVELDKALARRKDELYDVKIRSAARVSGPPQVALVDPTKEHFIFNSGHFTIIDRKMHDFGMCYYFPLLFREVPSYYEHAGCLDVAMIAVSPMDKHGYFNFGLNNVYSKKTCEMAQKVILEVNSNMPRVPGGNSECLHISEVDYIVEANWPLMPIPEIPVSDTDRKIAENIMPFLEDGCCIQLGIGALPNAMGRMIAQSDLRDLGVHSEMLCDAYLEMWKAGRITNNKKSIDRGKMVFTFALGSAELYDFVDENPAVASYPVDYTNYPHIIAQNDKVLSINNALELDLYGQVAAESSGSRQISGTGGQVDFVEGAYLSRGGKSFIALQSTYKDKEGNLRSRINPTLQPGTIVTTTRSTVMYVATEYGVSCMKAKSTWERAEALIELAHPSFREDLIKEAQRMNIWTATNRRCTCQQAAGAV
ncbi:4-hydroxybutyrate coenzyme A transferase [Desulfocucumis palustris]|uniref:Probable butyrate:acetyl-CoA coenzyme A-transferase n=1 Tax=Desulfocucumis palustris TaxID=1898651 RepID=A0A2L2XFA7_9FIRM|nr:4-hydroxybutyrate coenzyme A transferase [Desulfocucumis palustris]